MAEGAAWRSSEGSPVRGGARQETVGLGILFGMMYFIQGIGEPTEGLIAQPVRSLLKGWGHNAAEIAAFSAILALPWSFKPLYGLLSDFVPLAGYRRKSYLIAASLATMVGLLVVYLFPLPPGAFAWLLLLLLLPTVGVAFSDVVVDALMVEKGRPRGITGMLQSIQWAAIYGGTILTGVLGGYLSQHGRQDLGFLLCAITALVALILTFLLVKEQPYRARPQRFREAGSALWRTFRMPPILAVGGFLFLWSFNPFSSSVLYVYMTRDMGFSEQFYGYTISILSVACVGASVAYAFYCRRVPFGLLIHLSIVTGILATVSYWAMTDELSAVVVTVAVGLTYMTACLVQFDLAARICPAETAGTVFALFMALTNLSGSLSTALGGYLFEAGVAAWGSRGAFNMLVGLGALFTAGCWLLVPLLRRHQSAMALGAKIKL